MTLQAALVVGKGMLIFRNRLSDEAASPHRKGQRPSGLNCASSLTHCILEKQCWSQVSKCLKQERVRDEARGLQGAGRCDSSNDKYSLGPQDAIYSSE